MIRHRYLPVQGTDGARCGADDAEVPWRVQSSVHAQALSPALNAQRLAPRPQLGGSVMVLRRFPTDTTDTSLFNDINVTLA